MNFRNQLFLLFSFAGPPAVPADGVGAKPALCSPQIIDPGRASESTGGPGRFPAAAASFGGRGAAGRRIQKRHGMAEGHGRGHGWVTASAATGLCRAPSIVTDSEGCAGCRRIPTRTRTTAPTRMPTRSTRTQCLRAGAAAVRPPPTGRRLRPGLWLRPLPSKSVPAAGPAGRRPHSSERCHGT